MSDVSDTSALVNASAPRCGACGEPVTRGARYCQNCGMPTAAPAEECTDGARHLIESPSQSGRAVGWTPTPLALAFLVIAATAAVALARVQWRLPWLAVAAFLIALVGLVLWTPTVADRKSRAEFGTALATGAVISGMFFLLTLRDEANQRAIGNRDQQEQARIASAQALDLQLRLQGNLSGIDLSNQPLSQFDLSYKNLGNADLYHVSLLGGRLLDTKFAGASLNRADLRSAFMRGDLLDGASLDGADLRKTYLNEADLRNAFLGMYLLRWRTNYVETFTRLQGAQLIDADMRGACVAHANLTGASLGGANLEGADLDYAHLQGASFMHDGVSAYLAGASFYGAHLDHLPSDTTGASFYGAVIGSRATAHRVSTGAHQAQAGMSRVRPIPRGALKARVVDIYDGQTFELTHLRWVRLIGVHAPGLNDRALDPNARHQFGHLAVSFVRTHMPLNSYVWYMLGNKRHEDKPGDTGRALVYIWLPNGQFLNTLLLENGLALQETDQGEANPYEGLFASAQQEARDAGRGMWGLCPSYTGNGLAP